MTQKAIPEAWLLEWFERTAQDNTLTTALTNRSVLEAQVALMAKSKFRTQEVQRVGLSHAMDICQLLDDADLFSVNRSVSLDQGKQMRPDVILFTQSAHYLLVELKTRPSAEREGVQELLAYGAAMKLRYPYVNEFIYIVVARAWEPLLARSVQALIMDGKRVLPLRWAFHEVSGPMPEPARDEFRRAALLKQFSLEVKLDLFDINFVQRYDPMRAISTCTFAVSRDKRLAPWVGPYFDTIARNVSADCRRIHQSGFVLVWLYSDYGANEEILHVTLGTVNQHWVRNGQALGEAFADLHEPATGIELLAQRQANKLRKSIINRAEPDDFFSESAAHGAAAEYFPQSSLSHELLHRNRNYSSEKFIATAGINVGQFEFGPESNLQDFVDQIEGSTQTTAIRHFISFGELADYADGGSYSNKIGIFEFLELLKSFRRYKGFQAGDESE